MGLADDPQSAARALAEGTLRGVESEAWQHFVVAWPLIERFIRARLVAKRLSHRLLEDCGQNVFTRVWVFRKTYRGASEAEFWAWLRSICDNERRRTQSRERRTPTPGERGAGTAGGPPALADPAELPPAQVASREAFAVLRECLERLDAKHRKVIELVYFRPQLSERAAAEVLGWSASNVHKVKTEALRRLLRCLRRKGSE
jgi:RNA polymerase sigma factor (sigma-70 family)